MNFCKNVVIESIVRRCCGGSKSTQNSNVASRLFLVFSLTLVVLFTAAACQNYFEFEYIYIVFFSFSDGFLLFECLYFVRAPLNLSAILRCHREINKKTKTKNTSRQAWNVNDQFHLSMRDRHFLVCTEISNVELQKRISTTDHHIYTSRAEKPTNKHCPYSIEEHRESQRWINSFYMICCCFQAVEEANRAHQRTTTKSCMIWVQWNWIRHYYFSIEFWCHACLSEHSPPHMANLYAKHKIFYSTKL